MAIFLPFLRCLHNWVPETHFTCNSQMYSQLSFLLDVCKQTNCTELATSDNRTKYVTCVECYIRSLSRRKAQGVAPNTLCSSFLFCSPCWIMRATVLCWRIIDSLPSKSCWGQIRWQQVSQYFELSFCSPYSNISSNGSRLKEGRRDFMSCVGNLYEEKCTRALWQATQLGTPLLVML